MLEEDRHTEVEGRQTAAAPGSLDMHAQRSAAAQRYEPRVDKLVWVTEEAMSGKAVLDATRARTGLDAEQFGRLLWHGGLHVARRRVIDADELGEIAAGSRVAAYWYAREPAAVPVTQSAICFDDDGLVAVNKPAWLPVQGTRVSYRYSLEHSLRELLGCPALQAIHRLDRATSGVNLFARNPQTAANLCDQFAKRAVHKEYLALSWPASKRPRWLVEGYLVRTEHPCHAFYTFSQEEVAGARWSRTHFERLAQRGERVLLRAVPETGRTHQLRVHLLACGTPIVGDVLYGPAWAAGTPWSAERLQLHAASIRVRLFRGGRHLPVHIRASADGDWLG